MPGQQLQDGTEALDPREERTLLRRICRSVTGTKIHDLPEGRGASLERLPDDASRARARARETLESLHRDVRFPEASPWRGMRDAVARVAGPDGREGPGGKGARGLGDETGT